MSRYQWLLVALLSANFGVVFFDRNVFSYLTSFIQPDLHLSNFQIGNIASAFSFSWAIAGLCVGSLVDRFGRRKLMLVAATVAFSVASVLSGFASGFAWLLGARLAISSLLVAYLVVFFTFAPLYLIKVRGFDQRHMSWIMSSFGVSSMAVAFLVPGSSDRFGRKPVILAASLLGLVLPLGLLFTSGTQIVPLMACIAVGAAQSGVFPLAMATIPSEIVGPTRTATALSLTMGVSEILGGVLAPSAAGKVADLKGLGMTLWILVGIVAAIIVLAALLRETAPAVLAGRKHGAR
jgi:MFS family permease